MDLQREKEEILFKEREHERKQQFEKWKYEGKKKERKKQTNNNAFLFYKKALLNRKRNIKEDDHGTGPIFSLPLFNA